MNENDGGGSSEKERNSTDNETVKMNQSALNMSMMPMISMDRVFQNLQPFVIANVPLEERRAAWEKWRRAFSICCRAAGNLDDSSKFNMLLAQGGLELQEIFFEITGTGEDTSDSSYDDAIDSLNSYFAPKRHQAHERYLFHKIVPNQGESLDKFFMRAQVEAKKCNFGSNEQESRNLAVIDKMLLSTPRELREKILLTEDLNVDKLQKLISSHQLAKSASEQFAAKQRAEPVQKISSTWSDNCNRCGKKHAPVKEKCQAYGKICGTCGFKNHFKAFCKTKTPAKPSENDQKSNNAFRNRNKRSAQNYSNEAKRQKRESVQAIESDSEDSIDAENLNMIKGQGEVNDFVWASVAEVKIRMQIDSGAKSNIIDDKTWALIQKSQRSKQEMLKEPDKKFRAYAQKDFLTCLGMFESEIIIDDLGVELKANGKFYVIKDGPQPLLGKKKQGNFI